MFGIATPTEAAGVGDISSLILGYLWGDLSKERIFNCFYNSAVTYGSIGFVVVGDDKSNLEAIKAIRFTGKSKKLAPDLINSLLH